MNNNPLVSIIIPVYNGEKYVEAAIKSALNQTYKNIEIIVVNDGSIDNTEKICKKYKNKIKYYSKENGGVSTALNLAIDKMQGEYFSWLSHDDLYAPDKIETQIKFLNTLKNKDIIIYSDYGVINAKGEEFTNPVILNSKELKEKPLYAFLRCALNGITLLIPTKAFKEIGKFDENLRCVQDYDLWWKMKDKYKLVHQKHVTAYTRVHSNQESNTNPRVIKEGNPFFRMMIDSMSDKDKIKYEGSLYNFYYEMAKYLMTTPYKDVMNECIEKCKKIDIKKYKSNPVKNKKTPKEIIIYIKDHGLIYTIKHIFKKVCRNFKK